MVDRLLTADPQTLRRERTSIKWRLFDDDVLPLWVAEMDTAPCPAVVDAVSAALRRGDTGYGVGSAYADALARYAADHWSWRLDISRATAVADVMIGVEELLRELTDPGDAVVVSSPVYNAFFGFLEMMRRRVVEAPLTEEGRLDEQALVTALADARAGGRRAAYLLCNPHNPTGTVHTRAELELLARLCRDAGVPVVSDEIHAPLVLEGDFVPWLSVDDSGYAVLSASKGWNLAGLKAALVVAGSAATVELHEVHTHGASHLGMIAHIAAFDDGRAWMAQLHRELRANRELLTRLLAEQLPEVRYRPGAATYLAWLDCRALGLGDDPAAAFRRHGVALSPGPSFGTEGAGCARLNLATSPAILEEAVRRMAQARDLGLSSHTETG